MIYELYSLHGLLRLFSLDRYRPSKAASNLHRMSRLIINMNMLSHSSISSHHPSERHCLGSNPPHCPPRYEQKRLKPIVGKPVFHSSMNNLKASERIRELLIRDTSDVTLS